MYLDILFLLTKAIQVIFELVTTYYQILKTWKVIMQRVTISSTRYHSSYHTFSLSLTWIGDNSTCHHNFNLLPHTLTYIFFQCSMV